MPARTIAAPPERWTELGQYVIAQREALEMDQAGLVRTSEVSQSVVSKIENGRPDNGRVTAKVLRKLSLAIVHPPDALERFAVGELNLTDLKAYADSKWKEAEEGEGWEATYGLDRPRVGWLEEQINGLQYQVARLELLADLPRTEGVSRVLVPQLVEEVASICVAQGRPIPTSAIDLLEATAEQRLFGVHEDDEVQEEARRTLDRIAGMTGSPSLRVVRAARSGKPSKKAGRVSASPKSAPEDQPPE